MFKRLKLFHKTALIITTLLLLSLTALGIRMLSLSKKSLQSSILKNHTHLARIIAQTIDEFVGKLNLDLSFLLVFERSPKMSWAQKNRVLFSAIEGNGDFATIALIDEEGKEEIRVINSDLVGTQLFKKDYEKSPTFQKVKDTGRVKISALYYVKDLPCLDIVYPLATNPKKYAFIVVSLDELWKKIKAIRIGRRGFTFVVNGDGKIILHPDQEKAKNLVDASHVSIVKRALSTRAFGSEEFIDIDKEKVVGAYALAGNLDWRVIVQQARSEAYLAVNEMKSNAIGWIFISGLFAILVAFYFAKNMSRPVLNLVEGTRQLAKSNFDYEVKINSHDELGFLAQTFNSMAQKIKESQKQLIDRERLAALGRMASAVGHEIRNPLNAINAAVYYIKSKLNGLPDDLKDNVRIKESIKMIEREVVASNKIVGDLLGFSRTREPVLQPVSINHLLDEPFSVIQVPENVKLERKISEKLPVIYVDPNEMRQVLINLITNAFHAMSKGGSLTITALLEENSGQKFASISISDTGCGIPKENMEKLFTPFFSTKSQGTGLGLAVIKRVVERHKGKISVKSEVGKGTTFNMKLPIIKKESK